MQRSRLFLILFLSLLVFSCQEKTEVSKDVIKDVATDKVEGVTNLQEIQEAIDLAAPQEDLAIQENIFDIFYQDSFSNESEVVEISKVEEEVANLIPCGDYGWCNKGFICVDNKLCCPENMAQNCGGQCFPQDCQCVVDGEFVLCLSENMKYCGKGISCKKEEECHLDFENYYCVSSDELYCSDGLICKKNTEDCYSDEGKFYCKEKGLIYCGQEKWCENWQVCPDCCPKEQPIKCGETCCFSDEYCIEDKICLTDKSTWCNGEICVPGEVCAPDGLPICYPETGDYCGNGKSCDPGFVCASDGGCCPQGQPQRCGKICCPESYDCLETDFGKKCCYPGSQPCGDICCDPDEYCIDESKSLCLNYLAILCPDGHICEDGLYCAGPTCCSYFKPNQNCGSLCCPKDNWQCIKAGEACIPDTAQYIGNGKYCLAGTELNPENNHCDPVGWEPCGAGPACPPNQKCAQDKKLGIKQCCPADQATFCKDKCCYTGFGCCSENICMPAGGECCWGTNVNEWCPPTTTCGKKGKKCIPIGADECENGDFCAISEKCTESQPSCCPWSVPIPCVDKCCAIGFECKKAANGANLCCQKGAPVCGNYCCSAGHTCEEFNGKLTCISPDTEVCFDTIMGDTLCNKKTSFCGPDGACIDKKYKGQEYDYCGGGKVCEPLVEIFGITFGERQCAGLCSDVCCEQQTECNLESCFSSAGWGQPKVECKNNKDSITCCKGEFYNIYDAKNTENEVEECAGGKCKNLNCEVKYDTTSSQNHKVCCTYDKPKTLGCLTGCILKEQLCYDIPSSNSSLAYKNPNESGINPLDVPHDSGDCIYVYFSIFGNLEYIPAGLSESVKNGIFEVGSPWFSMSLSPGDEVLVVEAAWVIDPLEGEDCPHGPFGRLYINTYPFSNFNWQSDKAFPASKGTLLPGPHWGGCPWKMCWCVGIPTWFGCLGYNACKCISAPPQNEWAGNEFLRYTMGKAAIYKWEGADKIYISIMEGDQTSPDDIGGVEVVTKEKTKTPCGLWVPFYKFLPDAEAKLSTKTNKISMFLLLRTITCTGKLGDPC